MVNLVGGKVVLATDILRASKTMLGGVNTSYWGPRSGQQLAYVAVEVT